MSYPSVWFDIAYRWGKLLWLRILVLRLWMTLKSSQRLYTRNLHPRISIYRMEEMKYQTPGASWGVNRSIFANLRSLQVRTITYDYPPASIVLILEILPGTPNLNHQILLALDSAADKICAPGFCPFECSETTGWPMGRKKRPLFLVHDLPERGQKGRTRCSDLTEERGLMTTILGTSGSGKTRLCFELQKTPVTSIPDISIYSF